MWRFRERVRSRIRGVRPWRALLAVGSTKEPPPFPTDDIDDDEDAKPDDEDGPMSPDETTNRADAFAMTPVRGRPEKADRGAWGAHSDVKTACVRTCLQVGSKVTKIDGRELAVNSTGRVTYVDNFWVRRPPRGHSPPTVRASETHLSTICAHHQADNASGSGFDVMIAKQKAGKDILRELADWMRERCVVPTDPPTHLAHGARSRSRSRPVLALFHAH